MKKYLLGILLFSIVSCGNSDDLENIITNNDPPLPKLQTLKVVDEDINNDGVKYADVYDFKFEYNQDKLVKVWDIHGNFTENLTYTNGLISRIDIQGNKFKYPGIPYPFSLSRKLSYDSSGKIIKSEPLYNNIPIDPYVTFEYPSSDMIVMKQYGKVDWSNNIQLKTINHIYVVNQNVTKIEEYENSVLKGVTKYEYDQKLNPNFTMDRSLILGLPEYAFNLHLLNNYAQISKNNIVKWERYSIDSNGSHNLMYGFEFEYTYQNNGFPATITYHYPQGSGDIPIQTSATFGF